MSHRRSASVSTVPAALDPEPQHAAARGARRAEAALDALFGAAANPLRQLGALATLAFWIALGSGAWLYAWFDTSATGAWQSVAAIEASPLNGIVRSLHRYAADAFLLLMLLHLLLEWARGRYRGFRWFSWLTGVPLLALAIATGLVGYWLVTDTRAQFVATGLGEWLGALPGIGAAMVRNFVTAEAVSDRLFSLLVFLHIGIGLLILLALWVHLARLVRPRTQPARPAAGALAAALLALALLWPATSTPVADFARVPGAVPVDWLVFGVLPLMYATTPAFAWAVVIALLLLLLVLPWTARVPRPRPVVVDLANCNGCGRCFDDCPYGAVVMAARSDGRPHRQQAAVRADLCAGCGICVGACPSSTPFRSVATLVTGIDLPQRPLDALRAELADGLAAARARGAEPAVHVGCEHCSAPRAAIAGDDAVVLTVPCSGALPPAFVEYALRLGASEVVIADCGEQACAYRFGGRFTRERLRGERDPYLRPQVRGPQVRVVPCEAAAAPRRPVAGDGAGLQRADRRLGAAALAGADPAAVARR